MKAPAGPVPGTPSSAGALLNGYIGASVVHAFSELGLFDMLDEQGAVPADRLAAGCGAAQQQLDALVGAAASLGIVRRDGDLVSLTGLGQELRPLAGYFTVTVGGYGDLFRSLPGLVTQRQAYGRDVVRDDPAVAKGCKQNHAHFGQDILREALAGLSFTRMADLGCGQAGRLIDVCRARPGTRGWGLDLSPQVCVAARQAVREAGLDSRIQISAGDVCDLLDGKLAVDPEAGQADLVSSFFVFHHLTQYEDEVFVRLRSVFPAARYFVIADGVSLPAPGPDSALPIFSVGYELFHAMMGVQIPAMDTYLQWFKRAELAVEDCVPFGHPQEHLFILRAQ